MKDDQTNTATSKSAGIQTIPAANINAGGNTNISYDSERLAIFLKRILPHLEEELKDCAAAEDDVSNPNNDYNGEDQNKAVALDDKQIVFKPKELEVSISARNFCLLPQIKFSVNCFWLLSIFLYFNLYLG